MSSAGDRIGILNVRHVEQMRERFGRDPSAVPADWRELFEAERSGSLPDAGPLAGRSPGAPAGDVASRTAALQRVALFRDLSAADLAVLASAVLPCSLEPGTALFRAGDPGDALYVVTRGALRVEREGKVLAALGPGEVVGEMAVVDKKPRSADVVAHGRVELLGLAAADFDALVGRHASIARGLFVVVAERLRQTNAQQERVDALVRAFRTRGHAVAAIDPLGRRTRNDPELELAHHGLGEADLDVPFAMRSGAGSRTLTLREMVELLRNTYCRSIGVQFMHIDDQEVRDWLQARMEQTQNRRALSVEEQRRILAKLTDAEVFETFIHKKFLGAKRFSLEGAESLIPLLDLAIEASASHGVEQVVIGMAHRGRLNVLANVMGKSPRRIFEEFQDKDPERQLGGGDVKYHLGYSSDRQTASGRSVHLSLCFNPSHLEFVGPVVLGRVRAKQEQIGDAERRRVMGMVIHGDAAFAGQGVVQEMLNMSGLPGYATGGTVHVIVNNQIGFTTDPEMSRSSPYATDIARTLDVPIFHVNGEDPEAVAQAIELASAFRARFSRDVVVDMYCYRRHGHNEGDEPTYTQPVMYRWIANQPPVRVGYLHNLEGMAGVDADEADAIVRRSRERLEQALSEVAAGGVEEELEVARSVWEGYQGGPERGAADAETGVPRERLAALLEALTRVPDGFHVHPKLQRLLDQRREMAAGRRDLDWGAGEALAFATLVTEGAAVRLSGQDVGRGTFSHRHAVLHDHEDGHAHVPLQHLAPDQAPFLAWNSPLTETAVLGFDWGYSLDSPGQLTVWEAQFGDFTNVAQVILDQFVSSAEQKWRRLSGLVLLLPHGFEGQGPEHSSARLERFLGMCAHDNIQVASPTTPAQIFHLLRRQVRRSLRKPLVVMAPKSLLRHPAAVSGLDAFAAGTFQRVIGDPLGPPPAEARGVLLCNGRIYYDLLKARGELKADRVAILRLEQLYPLPDRELAAALASYPAGLPLTWVQDEPVNMGAWSFLRLNLDPALLGARPWGCVARGESASPATGSAASHRYEQGLLLEQALSE